MKTQLLIIFSVLSLQGWAQQAPASATKWVVDHYPQSQNVKWKVQEGGSIATFYQHERFFTTYFDQQGQWSKTTRSLRYAEIPTPVKQYCRENHPKTEIEFTEAIEEPTGTKYQLKMTDDDNSFQIVLNAEGQLLESGTGTKASNSEEDDDS